MLTIRIFLYTICFISVTWLAAIFAGPSVISKDNSFIFKRASSRFRYFCYYPNLNIKIGRLDFDFKHSDGQVYQEGFSRSVNIKWAFFDKQPLITVNLAQRS